MLLNKLVEQKEDSQTLKNKPENYHVLLELSVLYPKPVAENIPRGLKMGRQILM